MTVFLLVATLMLSPLCSIPLAGLSTAGPLIGGRINANPTPREWSAILDAVKANDAPTVARLVAPVWNGPPDSYEPEDTLFLIGRYKSAFVATYQRWFCGNPKFVEPSRFGGNPDAYERALRDASAGNYASAIRKISKSGTSAMFPGGQITLGQLYWLIRKRHKAALVWRYATAYSYSSKSPDSGPNIDTIEALQWYIYAYDHKNEKQN